MRVTFTRIRNFCVLVVLMLLTTSTFAQLQSPLDIALRHLEDNKEKWNLTEQDISDLIISDNYVSTPSQATMLYLMQRYNGVKVNNAIFNVGISKEGKVVHAGNRIVSNIANKVNTTSPSLTSADAVKFALEHLELEFTTLVQKERKNSQEFVFEKGTYSRSDIPVSLQLFPNSKNEVRLVWNVAIEMTTKDDYWNLKVDAVNGKILKKHNLIIKCKFVDNPYHRHDHACSDKKVKVLDSKKEVSVKKALANAPTLLGGSYNVYAEKDANGNLHPHESPIHGDRNLLSNVDHPVASPFGWHDINGMGGAPDFTITRGNNVHAYLDLNSTNGSSNDEPDGDIELVFDFPIDITNEPETFEAAATVNSFFMGNYIHDFAYMHGFDEVAGNFQANNYGNGGAGNDHVLIEVHDGSGTNNANFATPGDGGNGRMQMFLWNAGTVGLLTVNEPAGIAGVYDTQYAWTVDTWGAQITDVPLTAEVAIVSDGTLDPTTGCEPLINGSEVDGKIAIIDRGLCQFSQKALMAQNAGAVGVIICNFEDALPPLGGGDVAAQVNIPVVGISSGDCTTIRGFAGSGLNISFVQPANSGPEFVSGAIDNGIIAHEYGHGISNRLVGGPNAAGCLGNGEQMGEGISDFFSLVTTVKPGDVGEQVKGIGTYTQRQDTDGRGIRRFQYSTDMSINPLTYKDIVAQGVHARGEVWTLALWEMYWLLVEEYGFNPDLMGETGGNNIAVKLAIEGMKLTTCSPGYLDGRDGVLAADQLLYNGDNQCIIWEAFAKRGMGENANQVSADNTSDGFEDFSVPGTCTKDIRISKTVTDIVQPGEIIDVSLNVINYKDNNVANVVVTDEIPTGTTVVAGSATNGGTVNGDVITFELGAMATLEDITITYQLETDPTIASITAYKDDMEDGDDDWDLENIEGDMIWTIRDDSLAHSGENAWFVRDPAIELEQTLFTFEPIEITGTQPVLRFYHWYDTEYATDGGLIEVSKDGIVWEQVGDHIFREGYPRTLSYQTFVIPFLSAYSGESDLGNTGDFTATYVDLSEYLGENLRFRFRFGADADVGGIGWFVDDVEVMDMRNYDGQACLTSDDGDDVCAIGIARGTIVGSEEAANSTKDLFNTNMEVKVFPNPASDMLNLHIKNDKALDAAVRIVTVDGKEMMNQTFKTSNGLETMTLDVANLAAGMYFVKVSTVEGIVVEKLTIK